MIAYIQSSVDQLNSGLNKWETIKKFEILDRDFTVDEGELTPSLKVKRKVGWKEIQMGMGVIRRVLWHVGARSDYRDKFWQAALPLLRKGQIEEVIHLAVVSYHLIKFARDIAEGRMEACFYSDPSQSTTPVAEKVTVPSGASQAA